MNIDDLIRKYVNKETERTFGRYNSSELYAILKGYTKPEDFFKARDIDYYGSKLISEGVAIEDYLSKVFKETNVDCEYQIKKEIKINDEIILVAKPDYIFKNFIIELKRPKEINEKVPEKWAYQLEAYYRGFYLPVLLWQVSYPLTIKQTEFTPSKQRWEKIKKMLVGFHEKVKLIKGRTSNKLDQKI